MRAALATAPYKAVLFDLDDTLFDHQYHRRAALAAVHAAARLDAGIGIRDLERAHEAHLQVTYRELLDGKLNLEAARARRMAGMLADVGLTPSGDELRAFENVYRASYDKDWRTVPGARELIAHLRGIGTRIAVITNGQSVTQRRKLEVLGLSALVDEVVISEEIGCEKPAPAFFGTALQRVGAGPREALVVGDLFDTDIAGALAAGIPAVWLNRYGHASRAAKDLREISRFEPLQEILSHFEREPG